MLQRVEAFALPDDPEYTRALNQTLARCRKLFVERTDLRARERGRWLNVGINPLYATRPPTKAEKSALASLAFVGWCWRAAERGEPERLRASIVEAHAAAQADSSVPEGYVPAWAAWRFLADGGQLGLASPGASDRAKILFLDAAFMKMYEWYGQSAGIGPERARAAFNHGVALCDVERIVYRLTLP
jgi:hypothetical protein